MRAGRLITLVLATAAVGIGLASTPASATPTSITGTVVSPKMPLNARTGPAVWHPAVRSIANGAAVALDCQVNGQLITAGPLRVTRLWNRLTDGTFVSDAWIQRGAALPDCASRPAAAAPPAAAPAAPAAASSQVSGVVVTGRIPLKIRTAAAHGAQQTGALPDGSALTIVCQQAGEQILGTMRITNMWDRLAGGGFVSDAYVRRGTTPPPCAAVSATAAPATTWVHPLPGFPAGNSFRTPKQPYHIGVDLMAFNGTPIRAASAGRVVEIVCNIEIGLSCDKPGSPSIRGCGWYVKLEHPERVSTLYCHLVRKPDLAVGQQVSAGQVIGHVGSSGNSSFPHLHFEVHTDSPPTGPHNAVNPITFMRSRGVALDR